MACKFMFLYNT